MSATTSSTKAWLEEAWLSSTRIQAHGWGCDASRVAVIGFSVRQQLTAQVLIMQPKPGNYDSAFTVRAGMARRVISGTGTTRAFLISAFGFESGSLPV